MSFDVFNVGECLGALRTCVAVVTVLEMAPVVQSMSAILWSKPCAID